MRYAYNHLPPKYRHALAAILDWPDEPAPVRLPEVKPQIAATPGKVAPMMPPIPEHYVRLRDGSPAEGIMWFGPPPPCINKIARSYRQR